MLSFCEHWILIRDIDRDHYRYLVSPAFERDVAPWHLLQRTWNENCREVMSIFRPKSEDGAFLRSVSSQLSFHPSPGRPPRYDIPFRSAIKMRDGEKVAVDVWCCLDIVSPDRAYWYIEYLQGDSNDKPPAAASSPETVPTVAQSAEGSLAAVSSETEELDPPWLNWDNLQDMGELNELLGLLF